MTIRRCGPAVVTTTSMQMQRQIRGGAADNSGPSHLQAPEQCQRTIKEHAVAAAGPVPRRNDAHRDPGQPSARQVRDGELMPILPALWLANYRVYGVRKLHKAALRGQRSVVTRPAD